MGYNPYSVFSPPFHQGGDVALRQRGRNALLFLIFLITKFIITKMNYLAIKKKFSIDKKIYPVFMIFYYIDNRSNNNLKKLKGPQRHRTRRET